MPYFPIPRVACACARCSAVILDPNAGTIEAQDKGYRRVYFNVIGGADAGARLFISLCAACAEQETWGPEAIAALEAQIKHGWMTGAHGKKHGWTGADVVLAHTGEHALTWAEVQ